MKSNHAICISKDYQIGSVKNSWILKVLRNVPYFVYRHNVGHNVHFWSQITLFVSPKTLRYVLWNQKIIINKKINKWKLLFELKHCKKLMFRLWVFVYDSELSRTWRFSHLLQCVLLRSCASCVKFLAHRVEKLWENEPCTAVSIDFDFIFDGQSKYEMMMLIIPIRKIRQMKGFGLEKKNKKY